MNKTVFAALPLVLIACGGGTADPTLSSAEPESRAPVAEDRAAKDGGSPDAGECTQLAGSGTSCEKDVRLFDDAVLSCTNDGLYLNSFTTSAACSKGESKAFVVTCCTTPPSCTQGGGMGGPQCETDDSFFVSAVTSCPGGAVSQFETSRSGCQKGHADSASFTCACL